MRTDLDHLPPQKQRELERVVQLIFEEFDDAFALARHERKKAGRILKVILYGSYARGTWVDEPHTAKGYRSDFDLLIIVSDKRLTDRVKYWAKLDERLMREYGVTGTLQTPVNFIVHTLQEVNDGLAHGRYFFMEVKQEGIAVYQTVEPAWNGMSLREQFIPTTGPRMPWHCRHALEIHADNSPTRMRLRRCGVGLTSYRAKAASLQAR
jgi:predicted nucleotidyltransferase